MKGEKPSLNSMVADLALLTETQREQLMLAIEQLKTPTTKTSVKITQLAGLGKEMWRQIDVEKYIQDLRDEWGDRKIR
jgi:hypothetical protein